MGAKPFTASLAFTGMGAKPFKDSLACAGKAAKNKLALPVITTAIIIFFMLTPFL
jgi:hypothetical protein